jgi:hypothetical protein
MISNQDKLKCIERELNYRRYVYPRRVAAKRMTARWRRSPRTIASWRRLRNCRCSYRRVLRDTAVVRDHQRSTARADYRKKVLRALAGHTSLAAAPTSGEAHGRWLQHRL